MRGILPDGIIDRPKQGFAIPLANWFRGQLDGYVQDLLLSETSRGRQLFNPDYLEQMLRLHAEGRYMGVAMWTLISFELWCRRFLDQPAYHGNAPQVQTATRPLNSEATGQTQPA